MSWLQNIALLEKTEITVRTPFGEATLVIARIPTGYSCAVWSKDELIGSSKIGKGATLVAKAAVLGGMLIKAKEHVAATHDLYPDGVEIVVRVEENGVAQETAGKIPLDTSQVSQLMAIFKFVRIVNEKIHEKNT